MAVIDQLKEINNLQFDEEGRVKIVPLSNVQHIMLLLYAEVLSLFAANLPYK